MAADRQWAIMVYDQMQKKRLSFLNSKRLAFPSNWAIYSKLLEWHQPWLGKLERLKGQNDD